MCRSVTIGDILNFGITADVFLYARRLEINLTYSLMFGETAICYHSGFVLFETKETEVTIMILCNISDIICVCFVSLETHYPIWRQASALVARVKIRDALVPCGRLFIKGQSPLR